MVTAPISGTALTDLLRQHRRVEVKNTVVDGPTSIPDGTVLEGENVHFKDRVEGDESVRSTGAAVELKNATFDQPLDLYLGTYKAVTCDFCVFNQVVNLHSVTADRVEFNSSTFKQRATFVNSQFQILSLYEVNFEAYVNLSGARTGTINTTRLSAKSPVVLDWSLLGSTWVEDNRLWVDATEGKEHESRSRQIEAELRFWKRNFEALGQKSDALAVNRALVLFHRDHELDPTRIEWWATYVLDAPSGYGTSRFRMFWVALLAVGLFAAVFRIPQAVEPVPGMASTHSRTAFAVAASTQAFLPLVKLPDVEKWGWRLTLPYLRLQTVERVLGLVILGLAAYSVKSYIL